MAFAVYAEEFDEVVWAEVFWWAEGDGGAAEVDVFFDVLDACAHGLPGFIAAEDVEGAAHEGGGVDFIVFEGEFAVELEGVEGFVEFFGEAGGGGFGVFVIEDLFVDAGTGVGGIESDSDFAVDDVFGVCVIGDFCADDVFFDLAVHPGGDVALDEFCGEGAGS